MDDQIDRLVIGVRADTAGFARDVAAMRGQLDGSLATGAERAARAIETSLLRAVRTGKLGFDDLKTAATAALDAIAGAAIKGGIRSLLGSGGLGGGSGGGGLGSAIASLLGAPGRATGGPVAPGRAYRVGERGPELFVPTSSGRIEAGDRGGGVRDVRVAITVNAAGSDAAGALTRSSRQVARAVRAALAEE